MAPTRPEVGYWVCSAQRPVSQVKITPASSALFHSILLPVPFSCFEYMKILFETKGIFAVDKR